MSVKAPGGRQEVVLIVEDDPTLRLGLTKTLRSEGFRVEVAKTGTEGLEAALSLFDHTAVERRHSVLVNAASARG